MSRNFYVVPAKAGWDLKTEGAAIAISHHATREEAVRIGEAAARRQKVEFRIEGEDMAPPPTQPVMPAEPTARGRLRIAFRSGRTVSPRPGDWPIGPTFIPCKRSGICRTACFCAPC